MTFITRFAPSPTGPLHLGHAYSACLAHDMARAAKGQFVLRIEDIDTTRSRPHWERQILDDLDWLGLRWDGEVLRQTDRIDAYGAALKMLWQQGFVYGCTCNRRDIESAASAPQEGAPRLGPDGLVYPGTCRGQITARNTGPDLPQGLALRLDLDRALATLDLSQPLAFQEEGRTQGIPQGLIELEPSDAISDIGDIIISRKNFSGSYHLSVVLDDAAQNITDVIRGADLFDATFIHIVLQRLLDLPTPIYHHHRLIRDETGKRLAKRDDARAIARYRDDGATPADIRRMVGLSA